MASGTTAPNLGAFRFDAIRVHKAWGQLHVGDAEPLPQDRAVLQAWALFHSGEFQEAAKAGLQAGGAGITVANKASAIYANYLESREKTRLDMFMAVAERAERQTREQPDNPNAWYWRAYALGRYGQGISVAKALAQGLGTKVRESLEKVIALCPRHADAHIALGTFHAEVIDKVGALIGGMTYGAKKDVGLRMFEQALRLHPASPIGMVEYAKALLMLEGPSRMADATRLYEQAVATPPLDATEALDIALAEAELAD
jgi:tetratricopeptide (TPR) repeat protein